MQFKRRCHVMAGTIIALASNGCATLTTGTSQNLTLQSTPAGANCTLQRRGEMVGIVTAAPATLRVEKGSQPIDILCQLDQHATTAAKVEAGFQAMTLGNVLIGGLVGIAVDAASGAAGKYPDQVNVAMVPNRFETAAARDTYYDTLRQNVAERASNSRDWIKGNCQGDSCASLAQTIEQNVATLLSEIEQQQRSAVITPPAAND